MKATKQKMRQIENGKLSREKRMHDWKHGLKVRFSRFLLVVCRQPHDVKLQKISNNIYIFDLDMSYMTQITPPVTNVTFHSSKSYFRKTVMKFVKLDAVLKAQIILF